MATVGLIPGISVVVPAYRSEPSLAPLVDRLLVVLPTLSPDFEILLVNDGSPDGTWTTIERLVEAHQAVRGIIRRRAAAGNQLARRCA